MVAARRLTDALQRYQDLISALSNKNLEEMGMSEKLRIANLIYKNMEDTESFKTTDISPGM